MQKENVVKVIIGRVKPDVKISCHAELVSASSTHVVSQRQQQRQTWKTLNHYYWTPYYNLTGRGQAVRAAVQGDTPIFNNNGFTLIELLVVVLIIGILAAVALPQYKKAVWKSRNTQLKTVAATVNQAQQNYRLANGSFTRHFEELSIDLPLASNSGSACGMSSESDSGRYTSNFEVQLYSGSLPIIVWYTSGPYQCAGFAYDKDGNMWCVERGGFPGKASSFCAKLEKATLSNDATALYSGAGSYFYTLP